MSNSFDIINNTEENRFETTVDGQTAVLTYRAAGDNVLVYEHTIVPPELGGQGIGTALVKHALDFARENDKIVIPQCVFVAAYIKKHPEYEDVLPKQ